MPSINLFRLFARNRPMAEAMRGWGTYELNKELSLSMRQRELVIDRVCVRCGAEYEWSVHVSFFGERVGLDRSLVASLVHGGPDDACWSSEESAILRAVDELHESNDLGDETWTVLTSFLSDEQVLDLLLLAGWYHAISYAARATRIPLEDGAPRFVDYAR
jgi:alkylhydroperoxidase family enzyme